MAISLSPTLPLIDAGYSILLPVVPTIFSLADAIVVVASATSEQRMRFINTVSLRGLGSIDQPRGNSFLAAGQAGSDESAVGACKAVCTAPKALHGVREALRPRGPPRRRR